MQESALPTPAQIARTNMVESQLRPNRVYNPDLLAAMLNVPREAFLPDHLKSLAYADDSIKVERGRYVTEPLVTARLLEYSGITARDRVLVIGGAAAYVGVLASRLAAQVVVIEDNESLRNLGHAAIGALNIDNVSLQAGALPEGAPSGGPFDLIVIDGAVAGVRRSILSQLTEGGRLITVLAPHPGKSHGVVFERAGDIFSHRIVFDGFAPYLPGFEPKPQFEFS